MKSSTIAAIVIMGATIIYGRSCLINSIAFHPNSVVLPADQLPPNVREVRLKTIDQIEIQAYLLDSPSSNRILIYFHGNAGNISHRMPDLLKINSFGINVLGVGYRGYGTSQGRPSERGIYIDGRAALEYVTEELGYDLADVIILGRSIGTAVAIHVSQDQNLGGLILVTPLTSGKEHARISLPGIFPLLAGGSFNSIEKIGNAVCPILVVHGTGDNVIPIEMGRKMFESARGEKRIVEIEGAGHNDLSTTYGTMYWSPIHEFITQQE
jgi:fermentation-respiration switch protein FrsA (DUF1100 family)